MRRNIPRRAARAAAVVAFTASTALALAACGGGEESSSGGGGGKLKEEDSPLAQWYAQFDDGTEYTQADADAEMAKAEESIAQCMQDQGFEYKPGGGGRMIVASDGEDEDSGPQWGTKEWAAQNGYGSFAYATEEPSGGDDEYSDPNEDYVNAMTESEREAYYLALYGDTSQYEDDPDFDWSTIPPEEQGCNGIAWAEVGMGSPGSEVWNSEEAQTLTEDMQKLWEATDTDPEMAKANAAWADCMADAGYADKGWTTPSEPEQWFMEESNRIWEESSEGFDAENATEDTEYPDPTKTEEWKQLAEQEKDTAVADFTCREKVDFDQARLKVQFRLEQEFIDSHREQLDKLAALYEESQK